MAAQQAKLEQAGPLARFFLLEDFGFKLKEIGRLRRREARLQTELAMLRAAIAVAQRGPDEVKEFPDPFGHGPLKLFRNEKGFRLVSKLLIDDRPFTILFHRRLP